MISKAKLTGLYFGGSEHGVHFRYGLLAFDLCTLFFLFASSFFYGHPIVDILDVIIGILIALDFIARLWISKHKWAHLTKLYTLADFAVIVSLILPVVGGNFAFLRVVRMLRLLRSYPVLAHFRKDFRFFQENEDVILSTINLFIFIFVMTALVFEMQVGHNPAIQNYVDALYFTITALTTTGFGDITLQGSSGKWLSIIIMIFGVSLFIRLIQTVFRPNKVRYTCEKCGLFLHDRDASHCKACGNILNIPNEGIS